MNNEPKLSGREGEREGKEGGMNEGIKRKRRKGERVKSFHSLQLLIFVLTQNFWNFIVIFLNSHLAKEFSRRD